jgi:NNP family nitrate/nitrite transporter-like MFS transporter
VGCGFVVGIRLVGDWFPRRQLGLAEGIYAGCGNAGSALAALMLPAIAIALGWRSAALVAALPMLVWSVAFWHGVSDVPAGSVFRRTPKESGYSLRRDPRVIILAIAYMACFGSELCVVSFLPKYFFDKFEVSLVSAGLFAAIFGGTNIFARPGGGWLADRFGHKRVLLTLLAGMMLAYLFLGAAASFPMAVAAVVMTSLFVQSSEGAVFAIVPAVSPTHTGQIAGVVGAAGNVGGMLFPLTFGYGLEWTGGSYLPGFLVLAFAGAVAAVAVSRLSLPAGHAGHTHGFEFSDPVRLPVRVPMHSIDRQVPDRSKLLPKGARP